MIRRQAWVPDTHPEMRFVLEYDDAADPIMFKCLEATCDGIAVNGAPQQVYEEVLRENQTKNVAVATIEATAEDAEIEMIPTPIGAPTILKISGVDRETVAALDAITPPEVKIEAA